MAFNQTELEKLALGKTRSGSAGVMWRLLVFSLMIFLVMVISYIALNFGYKNILISQISKTETETESLAGGVSDAKRVAMIDFYSRLSNLRGLLKNHIYSSEFISLLESRINKNVSFNKATVLIDDGEVKLTGTARSFGNLAEQMEAFKTTEGVSSVVLDSAQAGEDGKVVFSLKFNLKKAQLLRK
ncbi:MAG: hypothetical protein A2430_00515 [Candidatus Liptonbacteria bacterium RIFOXYC1_FULL_36_8]|uniref:Uncharacterized protein n=3 Tax=Candidatus Liptoniibacteriota TaxID=1817909 RepID=A0A1G2CNP2_9BACT|nr:MAG: hypothetical protein A2390_02145 [Candidatus Liptonbacteria bacterium RIFOXYB1_FULL_36_10]OGZ03627.1 MAG: hypothetical protein A2430_00515 [Candidatus Liptonbacteria bacterium RIFOXYC1_FULL_36_8]OGZ03664.1 MAG: hypothetical protein A2604_01790 [Candidatus Liptonbacteria bacterium RIFOXYD1_FULL_36_11]